MSSLFLQKSIKNNSEELQDYLRELKNWEKDIKKEDTKLIEKQTNSHMEEIPPIRKKTPKNKPIIMNEKSEGKEKKKGKKPSKILACDYEAWDKFDVDNALKSESEEETETANKDKKQTQQKSTTSQTQQKSTTSQTQQKSTTSQTLQNSTTSQTLQNSFMSEPQQNNTSQSKEERAEKLKEEGNLCYSKGKLSDAVAKYTQGIGLNPSNPLLPANRAMAYIKLKKFKAAEKDCSRALQLDPNYIKAYLRRATARANLSNLSGAVEDYEKVLEFEPWNKDAKRELEKLKKEIPPKITDNKDSREESTKNVESNKMKKLKTDEVKDNHTKINVEKDSNEVRTVTKPHHLQSTKPLVNVPVIEVNSREEMEALLDESKVKGTLHSGPSKIRSPAKELTTEKKETSEPPLPKPPKTSHHFLQDWQKVKKFENVALPYLKSIPFDFFHGIEIEVDQLVEVVKALCFKSVESEVAASIMMALMKSQGFFLNMAFLELDQKKVLEKIISKIENCIGAEELSQLKESL